MSIETQKIIWKDDEEVSKTEVDKPTIDELIAGVSRLIPVKDALYKVVGNYNTEGTLNEPDPDHKAVMKADMITTYYDYNADTSAADAATQWQYLLDGRFAEHVNGLFYSKGLAGGEFTDVKWTSASENLDYSNSLVTLSTLGSVLSGLTTQNIPYIRYGDPGSNGQGAAATGVTGIVRGYVDTSDSFYSYHYSAGIATVEGSSTWIPGYSGTGTTPVYWNTTDSKVGNALVTVNALTGYATGKNALNTVLSQNVPYAASSDTTSVGAMGITGVMRGYNEADATFYSLTYSSGTATAAQKAPGYTGDSPAATQTKWEFTDSKLNNALVTVGALKDYVAANATAGSATTVMANWVWGSADELSESSTDLAIDRFYVAEGKAGNYNDYSRWTWQDLGGTNAKFMSYNDHTKAASTVNVNADSYSRAVLSAHAIANILGDAMTQSIPSMPLPAAGNTTVPTMGISGIARKYEKDSNTWYSVTYTMTGNTWKTAWKPGTTFDPYNLPANFNLRAYNSNTSTDANTNNALVTVGALKDYVAARTWGGATVYEFVIDPSNSSPSTAVTYPAGCQNERFAPAGMDFASDKWRYGDWENAFFMPTPVILKLDGTELCELNPNDYTLKKGGGASGIADLATEGNAMMRWPQVWWKFEYEGRLMHVYVADRQVNETFHCYTHYNKNGVLKDFIYTMIYQPCKDTEHLGASTDKPILRSMSGQTIATNNSGTNEILWAENNNTLQITANWSLMDYGMLQMIEWLAVLIGKSLDTQTIFGQGRSASGNELQTTGDLDKKGLFYGKNNNATSVKVFGMENIFANYWKRINGLCYSTTQGFKYKLTETTLDGSTKNGYAKAGDDTSTAGYLTDVGTLTGTTGSYISGYVLTPRGIFPKIISGTQTTYIPDGVWFAGTASFAYFGGCYLAGLLCGFFALALDHAVSHAGVNVGPTLSCKPL